jgi:hypothetical protein
MVNRWLLSKIVKELLASRYNLSKLSRDAASARFSSYEQEGTFSTQSTISMAKSTKGVYLMRHPFRVKLGIEGGIQRTRAIQRNRGLGQVSLTLRILPLKVRAPLGQVGLTSRILLLKVKHRWAIFDNAAEKGCMTKNKLINKNN